MATAAAAATALAAAPATSPFVDRGPASEPTWAASVEAAVTATDLQLRLDTAAHGARVQAATATETVEAPAPAAPEPARSVWDDLADCESGNWGRNGVPQTGTATWTYASGYFEGGLQFDPRTWDAFRDDDMPSHAGSATREQQIIVGERVQAAQGWRAWPVCSRKIGLR